jgi:hypothetical protein
MTTRIKIAAAEVQFGDLIYNGLGTSKHPTDTWETITQVNEVDGLIPSRRFRLLCEDLGNQCRHHATLAGRRVHQQVAHEMHPTTLPGSRDHLAQGRLQASMCIGDDQLEAP